MPDGWRRGFVDRGRYRGLIRRSCIGVVLAVFAIGIFAVGAAAQPATGSVSTPDPAMAPLSASESAALSASESAAAPASTPAPSMEDLQPTLKLKGPEEPMAPRFIQRVPEAAGRKEESSEREFLYADVATTSPLSNLTLKKCILLAMDNNFSLINARRDVAISRSSLRESEAFFIPFVELIGSSTYSESATNVIDPATGNTTRVRTTQNQQQGRAQVTQNFATGGNIVVGGGTTRTRDGLGTGPRGGDLVYDNEVDASITQPLLKGAGFDVGTANLRQARLSKMNQDITYRLHERDTVLQVIQNYFQLLQAAQELRVSRDALAEKLRFLEETRIKFQKGRVAESEILRAELQYLQEKETAVGRRQTFNDRRENLALTLGLNPDTPLSVQDVSGILSKRGRYVIPGIQESLALGLNSRLELLQSSIAYERARINVQVARNNVLPNLDLTAGYTTSDSDNTLGGATDLENNNWDAGLELRIPLPNIGAKEQRRRAELTLEKTRTNWDDEERQITEQILSAHRAVESAESSLAILERTVEQAKKNLELINGSFEVGYSTITEVRLAQDDLFQAQTNYNNTLLNYQIAIAQFYVAVGQELH